MACTATIDGRQPPGADAAAGAGTQLPGAAASSGAGGLGSALAASRVLTEPIHRLNRLEYDNTVRDLLGTSLSPARTFPPDPRSDGLDNAADGLTFGATRTRPLPTRSPTLCPDAALHWTSCWS